MFIRKKNFLLLLLLLTVLLFLGCAASRKTAQHGQPLIWKVEGDNPSYIFGTMHLADKRVTNLPDIVMEKFDAAEVFALEVDLAPRALAGMAQHMMLPNNETIGDIIPEDTYLRAKELLKEMGQDIEQYEKLKPWALMLAFAAPQTSGDEPMDFMLYNLAVKDAKEIIGLETMDEQVALFDTLSYEKQIELLEGTLDECEDFDTYVKTMVALYTKNDLEGLMDFIDELVTDETSKTLMDEILITRNYRFTERMIVPIEKGGAFIAVGVAHLGGEEGIIKLLQHKGYRIVRCDFEE